MALNYELGNVKNWETVTKHPDRAELNPATRALIWATMAIGIDRVTEKNADQFYRPLYVFVKHTGGIPPEVGWQGIVRRIPCQRGGPDPHWTMHECQSPHRRTIPQESLEQLHHLTRAGYGFNINSYPNRRLPNG